MEKRERTLCHPPEGGHVGTSSGHESRWYPMMVECALQGKAILLYVTFLILYSFPRYRRNLKAFYVVHPTLWARIVTWFFTTFTASSIKGKVHFLSGIQYLYDWIDPDQLEIPAFVLEYDMKVSSVA